MTAVLLGFWNTLLQGEENTADLREEMVEMDALERVRFERELESRLAQDVGAYLGHSRFTLSVTADFSRFKQIRRKALPRARSQAVASSVAGTQQQTPSLPPLQAEQPAPLWQAQRQQSEALLEGMEFATEDMPEPEELALPGAPFSEFERDKRLYQARKDQRQHASQHNPWLNDPRQNQINKSQPTAAPYQAPATQPSFVPAATPEYIDEMVGFRTQINRLTVGMTVDQEKIDREQEEFIRNLIFQKAQLDSVRGDSLRIVKVAFVQAEPDSLVGLIKDYIPYITYAIVALLGLLFLILLAILFRLFKKKPDESHVKDELGSLSDNAGQSNGVADEADEADEAQQLLQKLEVARQQEVRQQALKQDIVTHAVAQPEKVRNLAREEMLGEGGVQLVAGLHQVLGAQLFRSLFPNFSGEELISFEAYLAENGVIKDEELSGILEKFNQQILHEQLLNNESKTTKPFAFLDRLNDEQVLYLIHEEDIRIKTLVFSQLPVERGAAVIAKLKQEDQVAIAFELSEFASIPLDSFQQVANRLAKKAMDVPSFNNVSSDGVGLLVNMFDHLDGATEKGLFEQMQAKSPDLYHRIKQVYFTFSDMPRMPVAVLKNILREVDKGTLAMALSTSFSLEPSFTSSLIAILIATPFLTCSKTLHLGSFNTSSDISIFLFTGPGCNKIIL
jgi:flagellar motor switch protein FliG